MHPPPHTLSDYAMYIRIFSMGCTRTHVHDKKWSVFPFAVQVHQVSRSTMQSYAGGGGDMQEKSQESSQNDKDRERRLTDKREVHTPLDMRKTHAA